MKKIFVSYARLDSDRVHPVADILDAAKFDVWIDKNDIPIGEQWPEQIVQGIKTADAYLIFISPASLESKNVINELTLAYEEKNERGLQIIPIILTPTKFPDQARFQLIGIEWIDFSENFHRSLEKLIHILGAEALPKGYKKHLLNHLPGLQVTPELIAPYEKTSRDVVIGKTVTIDHIRDQRFITRKEVLAQVLNKFDLHLQEHLNSSNPEIFTFWIYGRSGSGKSVTLLQIMQEIILKRNAQVIWLDDAIEMLPVLLEKWANQQIELGEPLFIFADDFNAPHIRDRIDFKSIARLLRNPKFSKVMWPVLVTCSPPEYLNEFQATGNDEYFYIKKWLIPPISKSEQKGLLEWFKEKTGETPKPSVAYEQDEGLILSMMFELRHGNMMEFARRFKERLEGIGLLEKIAQPLALNRIYIWAPNIWFDELTPEQKDSLAALNLDQDFSIFRTENPLGKYIRLTHPHLSDVIYKAIRPDKAGYQRAEDLAKAFERTIQLDDVLASRILLAIAQGGERISIDLNEKILAQKIFNVWAFFVEIVSKSHPIGLAYIWTNLARWASREQHINDLFAPLHPLDKAIEILGAEYYSWGDLWLQLWACYPNNIKLVQSGWIWIGQRSHFEETSWYLVWQTLLSHSEILPQGATKTDILQIGFIWLNGHEDRRWWSQIWQSLLKHRDYLPDNLPVSDLIQIGANWLKERENISQWSFVWQSLLQYYGTFPSNKSLIAMLDYGVAWLTGREDQAQWAFVWQDIIKNAKDLHLSKPTSDLLIIGVSWLDKRENRDQWPFVWQTIIKYSDSLPPTLSLTDLLSVGLKWLDNRENLDQWPFVWQILVKHSEDLPSTTSMADLLNTGLTWLDDRENLNQWSFIWQILASHHKKIKQPLFLLQLINKGMSWINNNEHKKEWQIIYSICLARINYNKEIKNKVPTKSFILTGIRWIESHKQEYQAAELALKLIRSYYDDIPLIENNRLIELIKSMVYKSDIKHRGWTLWWLAYWEIMPTTENVKLALRWMEAYSENIAGAYSIINKLISTMRPDVIERITEWHIKHPQNPISEVIKIKLEKERGLF
jgi:hypothetical protein